MSDTDMEVVTHLVKFEVQLYKVRDDEFVIDMQVSEAWHPPRTSCVCGLFCLYDKAKCCVETDSGGWQKKPILQ